MNDNEALHLHLQLSERTGLRAYEAQAASLVSLASHFFCVPADG
jgi:hypothetical protein